MKLDTASSRTGLGGAVDRLLALQRPCTTVLGITLLQACTSTPPLPGSSDDSAPQGIETREKPSSQTVSQRRSPGQGQASREQPGTESVAERSPPPDDLWRRIAEGFGFALEHDNAVIRRELDWYRQHGHYLEDIATRAAPFLYPIVEEIDRRDLPLELALLPVVESGYDPTAVSGRNAAGLWQFMPATARAMGLRQDWWYDGRRDPRASTRAALDYLQSLHERFDGDWLLALAAYNAGQGTVSRAIRRNERRGQPTDFWSLSLPAETDRHVPRLIALSHLLADPERHDVALEPVPNQPAVRIVEPGSQVDLSLVARMADLDEERLRALNPGYRRWATHPEGPHRIAVPAEMVERVESGLAQLEPGERVTWRRYRISPGDTLGGIAQRFNTSVSVLQQVNGLVGSRIVAGENLMIPRDGASAASSTLAAERSGSRIYRVQPGDSLYAIARRHGTSVQALARHNRIETDALIHPGQELRLPPTGTN